MGYREYLAWGGFFVLSNYMTYFISKTAWENTIVFLTLFYLTLRILYTDSRRTIAAVTAFMAIGGVLSEFLTYYGWILVTHKSSFHIDSMNQNYLLTIISRLVLLVFIKLLILLNLRTQGYRVEYTGLDRDLYDSGRQYFYIDSIGLAENIPSTVFWILSLSAWSCSSIFLPITCTIRCV